MASYTPNYNLKKPADADTYDIADANGNMDLIDTALHSQNEAISNLKNYTQITGSTKTDIESALVTFSGNMVNGEQRAIWFANGTASAPMAGATYIGMIGKQENRLIVQVHGISAVYQDLTGFYKSGTGWEWYSVDDAIASLNANNTSDRSGTISVANSTRTLLTTKTIPATGLYLIIRGIDWSSNATGTRGLYKDMINAYRDSYVSQDAATTLDTVQQMTSLEEHAAGDSVYVCGIQSSGTSLTAYPYIFFVKLR